MFFKYLHITPDIIIIFIFYYHYQNYLSVNIFYYNYYFELNDDIALFVLKLLEFLRCYLEYPKEESLFLSELYL